MGVALSSFFFISPLLGLFLVVLGFSLILIEKLLFSKVAKEVLFLSILILATGFGFLRYSVKDFHEPRLPINVGIVTSEPEEKENTTRFVMRSDNGEKVLVSTNLYSQVRYGDRVSVEGQLSRPAIIDDGRGQPFNYPEYLSKDDIYYTLDFAEVTVFSSGHGHPAKGALLALKASFISKIKEVLAEPHSSLLAGLVVSGKEALPKDILDEFRRAGIIHIVVLSGYNITIIADFIRRFFQTVLLKASLRITPFLATGTSILAVIFFVLMTGAPATIVRAAIMVLVALSAKLLGQGYSASRALILAGFLMLVENPKILIFDPSFQLSFLATMAIIHGAPITERFLRRIPDKFGLRGILSTTLATQLVVLPLLVYSTGDFSLVSLLANVLVLLIIPLTMLLGFVATLVAYISVILALPLAFVANLLLSWILGVSNFLGNLSFASISVPSLPFVFVVLAYVFLAILFWRLKGSSPRSPN